MDTPMLDLFSSAALPLGLSVFFISYYHALAPRFHTEKQRAYILSALSSGTMTLISTPFVYSYLRYGLVRTYEDSQRGWMADLARFGVVFFATYLTVDLALGYVRYPNQIGMLTGWIHHIVYIGLMLYIRSNTQTPIFVIGAIMELPTFDLAISNLFPSLRNDLRFLVTFLLVRIVYHVVYLLDVLRPQSWNLYHGSYTPSVSLALALVLHVSWFRGGLKGYLKRQRALRSGSATRKSNVAGTASTIRGSIDLDDKLLETATQLDDTSTIPSNTLQPGLSNTVTPNVNTDTDTDVNVNVNVNVNTPDTDTGTPEDSPLVTPYTPSMTPFSLRDSYVFPHIALPGLGLPTVSLPAMPAIPSLSLTEMNANMSGFKEAVKSRWEEQRGRFGGGRLDVAGLRLRRSGGHGAEVDGQKDQVDVQEVRLSH